MLFDDSSRPVNSGVRLLPVMKTSEFWKPIIVSILVTPLALLFAFLSGGAGHGDYFWAKILFPYSMLSTLIIESNTLLILLTLIQFPFYGFLLAFAGEREWLRRFAVGCSIAHIVAAILCFILPIAP